MASATHTPAVTKVVTPETVTLTLGVGEAVTLNAVMQLIGGPAQTTRRGHTDAILAALREAMTTETNSEASALARTISDYREGYYSSNSITMPDSLTE